MLEHFPDPYPDEILYSVWARYSDNVQYSSRSDALIELFGIPHVRPIIDFPCRLQCFVDRLPFGHSYSADYFIDNHTLFPYYQAFLPADRRQAVQEEMTNGIGKAIHDRAVTSTRILPPTRLRYCPGCVEEDKSKFGECYWHRLHQLPGVVVCPSHRMLLEMSSLRMRFGFMAAIGLFSAERTLRESNVYKATSIPFFDTLLHITQESAFLLEHPHLTLDIPTLQQKYRAILTSQGLLTPRGIIRANDLFKTFQGHYSEELLSLFQCPLGISKEKMSSQWLGRILSLPGTKVKPVLHPLYHLLVIHFLGFTLKAITTRKIPTFTPFGAGPWPCLNPVCEFFQQRKIPIYQMKSSYKNKSVVSGEFACGCGYVYSRTGPDTSPEDAFRKGNVLSYGPVWDGKFRELWFDPNASKSKMAVILGISREYLDRHARRLQLPVPRNAPPAMIECETSPRRAQKDRSWYRAQWLAIVEDSPGETANALARKAKGVLTWLDRHDREWLRTNRPARKKNLGKKTHSTPSGNHRRISINRDALFATAVREVADKLILEQAPLQRMSKRRICQEIPDLRWIPNQDVAPLTAQALEEVAETSEGFALRRIDWALRQYMEERAYPSRNAFIERVNLRKILHYQSVQKALDEAMNVLAQFA